MDSDKYWFKARTRHGGVLGRAGARGGRGARHREEAAARPPSDSERSVLAPLLSSSRGRERRYYVVLRSSLNYYSLHF